MHLQNSDIMLSLQLFIVYSFNIQFLYAINKFTVSQLSNQILHCEESSLFKVIAHKLHQIINDKRSNHIIFFQGFDHSSSPSK